MELTNAEKLILTMLTEIYEKLGIDKEIDPKFVQEAIFSDNLWGLEWKYSGMLQGGKTPEAVTEVSNILEMWTMIENAHERLSPEDQARIKAEAQPFGAARFQGFDGNDESGHMGIARFLIDHLKRFTNFEGRELNSHNPGSLDADRRMWMAFEPLRSSLINNDLTADQVIGLLKERVHPSHRGDSSKRVRTATS